MPETTHYFRSPSFTKVSMHPYCYLVTFQLKYTRAIALIFPFFFYEALDAKDRGIRGRRSIFRRPRKNSLRGRPIGAYYYLLSLIQKHVHIHVHSPASVFDRIPRGGCITRITHFCSLFHVLFARTRFSFHKRQCFFNLLFYKVIRYAFRAEKIFETLQSRKMRI